MAASSPLSDPADRDRMPPGIPYIVGNEGAERFSYYGMRAILKIYLIALYLRFVNESEVSPEALAEAEAKSTEIVHLFFAGVYLFPLFGAIIADRLLGKYRTILWVSLIYCAGHAVLAVAGRLGFMEQYEAAELSMYIGLALIAIGSGGIKPCVSANVGDQFTAANAHLVPRVFQIFYFIINYGSFFSTVLTPLLLRYYGPEVAFGVPGVLMGVATVIFWMGRHKFVHVPPSPGGRLGLFDTLVTMLLFTPLFSLILGYFVFWEQFLAVQHQASDFAGITWGLVGQFFVAYWWLVAATLGALALGCFLFGVRQRTEASEGFLPVLLYNLTHQRERAAGASFFDVGRAKFGEEAGDGPPAVLKIVAVFSMVSVFWALFDQHASTWIDQAKTMDLGLSVPAYLGMWVLGATLVLSLYAGVWLFRWIANAPLPHGLTVWVVGIVLVLGPAAIVADYVAPPMGNVVEAADGTEVRERALSITIGPAQFSAVNPLFVMIIIPVLNVLVYTPLRRRGIEIKPLQRMTAGMFLSAVAFASAAILQQLIESAPPNSVHILWQSVQYFIMTTAEVLVSITGLEFAYTQAPRAMKSTMMGFWLFFVTMGNLLVAFLAPLQKTIDLSEFFWLFAGLMAGAAVIFAVMAWLYKGKSYLQHDG